METKQIDKKEYKIITSLSSMVFNKLEFCELNKDKVDEIMYVGIYKDGKPRFAFPLGVRGKVADCPFSAPFGYPEPVKSRLGVSNYEEAEQSLNAFLKERNVKRINLFLPPAFYDHNAIAMWTNVCLRSGWQIAYCDINYSIYLPDAADGRYEKEMDVNARRNLRLAQKFGLQIAVCRSDEEKEQAYRVIEENRRSKGYPLRMTWDQVYSTMKVVPGGMYLVCDNGKNIAAALVYEINSDIAQLIYWGDVPGHMEKKSMNFLSEQLIKIYAKKGFSYLDIGPASEEGIPNYGLCDFKDSIGCHRSIKTKIYKDL